MGVLRSRYPDQFSLLRSSVTPCHYYSVNRSSMFFKDARRYKYRLSTSCILNGVMKVQIQRKLRPSDSCLQRNNRFATTCKIEPIPAYHFSTVTKRLGKRWVDRKESQLLDPR